MYPQKATIFLAGGITLLVGAALGLLFELPVEAMIAIGASGLVIAVVQRRWRAGLLVGICLITFALGMWRSYASMTAAEQDGLVPYHGQTISFIGVVDAEPDVRSDQVKLTIAVQSDDDGNLLSGLILVSALLYPEYQYGDRLWIRCRIEQPGIIQSDDGRDFNYGRYVSLSHIYSVCFRPQIKLIDRGQGSPLISGLIQVKQQFIERLTRVMGEPEASFAAGLLVGAKQSLPESVRAAFRITGTSHIIALSGYNISIIAICIQKLCSTFWLSRRTAFWVAVGVIIFFVVMTGAAASVTRAGIMGGLVLLARQLGRMSRIAQALVLAACIMIWMNPPVLLYDIGFQLSFLATFGLVYLSPLIERWLRWVPDLFALRSSLSATLSAIVMTLPIIVYYFGTVSLIAPLVNVLILPFIPIAMGFGFVTGLLGFVVPMLAAWFGWLTWALLHGILVLIRWWAGLPFAAVHLPVISIAVLIIAYLVLVVWLWWLHKKPPADAQPAAAL
ncbi:MAG: ComEC/Rec2 family competence protein [Candidatus Kerfeldbacteria bacterium]|nr:ComEC/Rec2 family competence protein [Candidatus Kerfeldbacteria bacterium]